MVRTKMTKPATFANAVTATTAVASPPASRTRIAKIVPRTREATFAAAGTAMRSRPMNDAESASLADANKTITA